MQELLDLPEGAFRPEPGTQLPGLLMSGQIAYLILIDYRYKPARYYRVDTVQDFFATTAITDRIDWYAAPK